MSKCRVIRFGRGFHGLQSLDYFSGLSSERAARPNFGDGSHAASPKILP
ncbi:MAG TPA: hypothetical protein PLH94_15155 [Fimbriimonadaceae bacterium]|nr:hypothetical protein [Fimbriimonadaceae bacterium]